MYSTPKPEKGPESRDLPTCPASFISAKAQGPEISQLSTLRVMGLSLGFRVQGLGFRAG